MRTFKEANATRAQITAWRDAHEKIALVPTMGGLHAGHLALIARAREAADRVVVSVFVNRMQFDSADDYENYPGDLDCDLEALRAAAADLAFAPTAEEMFPGGAVTPAAFEHSLANTLEGESRPGHFAGVVAAVTRLFEVCEPDVAVFGEKDYQQLLIVRKLAAGLKPPVEIIDAPTVRDADGLALSSRNARLGDEERSRARALHQTLNEVAKRLEEGERDLNALESDGERRLKTLGLNPDYVAVRRRDDLQRASDGALIVLGAAHIGAVRLIDNVKVG